MKLISGISLSLFLLSIAYTAGAQLPPKMRARYTDAEYAAIMSKNHIHRRYHEYTPVSQPVLRGQVKIATEHFDQYQGPHGWYYCHPKDGECFDNKGLGVDTTGSCWVDKNHQCTNDLKARDVSIFSVDFRRRGDLGPPMTLTGQLPATSAPPTAQTPFALILIALPLPLAVFALLI